MSPATHIGQDIHRVRPLDLSGCLRLFQSFKIGRTGFTKTDKSKMSTHLISAFVFATQFVKSLLIKKNEASSHMWLHCQVNVGPDRKP